MVGDRKFAFLSFVDRDTHPTCTRCRGIFAPVTGFVTFVRFGRRLWELLCRRVLTLRKTSSRPSGSVPSAPPSSPRGNFFGSFASWVFFFFFFPPLRRAGGVSGCTWCFVWGGFPPLPLDLGRAGGVAVPLDYCLGRAGALPLLLLLRERARWGLPARCRLFVSALLTSLSLPNSHRTFHDVRIRGRLRSLASAYYPPVVLVLQIVNHGRIRGPGHVGVARGCRCGCRSLSSSRSRLRGRGRRLQLSSAWLSSRARSRRVRSRSSDRYR